jgi:hypothetical protein
MISGFAQFLVHLDDLTSSLSTREHATPNAKKSPIQRTFGHPAGNRRAADLGYAPTARCSRASHRLEEERSFHRALQVPMRLLD